MKRVIRPVYAGINGKLNKETNKYTFTVDFENNTEDDVVKFIEPYFHQSDIDGDVYWFGYTFNDGQSNPRRDEFIEFIKHVQIEKLVDPEDEWSAIDYDDDHLTESDLNGMIFRSLRRIHLNNYSVDTIVYPESKSGNLVEMIVRALRSYLSDARRVDAAELKKGKPKDINFDFEKYHNDINQGKIDVPSYVNDDYIHDMITRARNADTFSLRKYIKPAILRSYMADFYTIDNAASTIANSQVVLVVDDFGTTGSTVREIVRNIRKVNDDCEIYIFTLMGNRRKK